MKKVSWTRILTAEVIPSMTHHTEDGNNV